MLDVIITYALFAGGITANKYVLQFLSPVFFVGVRMLLSGIILAAYHWKTTKQFTNAHLKNDAFKIIFITICTTFIPSNLKSFSLQKLPASKATLLGSIDPFVTALLAYLLWKEKLSLKKICGIGIGLLGISISIYSTSAEEIGWQFFSYLSYPEMAQICAVIISRYGWISVQGLLKTDNYSPAYLNSLVMILSGVCSLSWALMGGSYGFAHYPTYPITFWAVLGFTVIFGNVVGYTSYGYCLKKHTSTFMALAGFLVPIFVALFSKILLHEAITLNFVIAMATLLCGIIIFYFDEIKKPTVFINAK